MPQELPSTRFVLDGTTTRCASGLSYGCKDLQSSYSYDLLADDSTSDLARGSISHAVSHPRPWGASATLYSFRQDDRRPNRPPTTPGRRR